MWTYFYYTGCPACDSIQGFMISISGTYNVIFNDVWADWWNYAKTVGVTRVPMLFNGVDTYDIGNWSTDSIESLLSS